MKKIRPEKNTLLIRIFFIICLLLVFAFVAYMIWNPEKENADGRNAQRNAAVASILEEMMVYTKLKGNLPDNIPLNRTCSSIGNEICKTGASSCKNLVDLSYIVKEQWDRSLLSSLPVDPTKGSENGTGYYISQDGEGNLSVCAPYAERNVNILVTKFAF